jgi:RNase P/RNase MRP subunit POP5
LRCKIITKENYRKRYIGFILSNNSFNKFKKEELKKEINLNCKKIFNKECREMGINLIKFDGEKGILRCSHTQKDNAIDLINSIKKVCNREVKFNTVGTSGTIKSLVKKHM